MKSPTVPVDGLRVQMLSAHAFNTNIVLIRIPVDAGPQLRNMESHGSGDMPVQRSFCGQTLWELCHGINRNTHTLTIHGKIESMVTDTLTTVPNQFCNQICRHPPQPTTRNLQKKALQPFATRFGSLQSHHHSHLPGSWSHSHSLWRGAGRPNSKTHSLR